MISHIDALWENHSCRQSMMVNSQTNHTARLPNHMVHIHFVHPALSIHLYLCITLKHNAKDTFVFFLPSITQPSCTDYVHAKVYLAAIGDNMCIDAFVGRQNVISMLKCNKMYFKTENLHLKHIFCLYSD